MFTLNCERNTSATPERSVYVGAADLQASIAHLKSICDDDDPELLADMIEGELSVESFVSKLVTLIAEDEASCIGLKTYLKKVGERRRRLENRAARLRVVLASVVNALPSRKYKSSLASVRAFDIEPNVVIDEEADIPPRFWKEADPVVNMSALRKHLNERRKLLEELSHCRTTEERTQRKTEIDRDYPDIPGCHLDNGDLSVSITVN